MARKSMADMVRQNPRRDNQGGEVKPALAESEVQESEARGTAGVQEKSRETRPDDTEAGEKKAGDKGGVLAGRDDASTAEAAETPGNTDGHTDGRAKGAGRRAGRGSSPEPGAEPKAGPKYLRMHPIAGRVREDQYIELVRISTQLNRRWKGGERITPNTLLRVGIDWLISQEDRLAGATEEEIRASVDAGGPGLDG